MVAHSQLSFKDIQSTGKIHRLDDLICWRRLEGRHCLSSSQRDLSANVDAVIVPIHPLKDRSKQSKPCEDHSGCVVPQITGSTPLGSALSDTRRTEQTVGILAASSDLAERLRTDGLHVLVDRNRRQTPGQKFNHWEACGVPLRIELGTQEVIDECASIAIHPAFARIPSVAAAAASAQSCQADPSMSMHASSKPSSAAATACAKTQAAPARPTTTSTTRSTHTLGKLRGIPMPHMGRACSSLLHAIDEHRCILRPLSTRTEPLPLAAHTSPLANEVPSCTAQQPVLETYDIRHIVASWQLQRGPSPMCGKLHLWEGLPAGGVQGYAGAGGVGEGKIEGAAARGTTATAAAAAAVARPCVNHVLWLVGSTRSQGPCQCGCGHVSAEELQQEVERQWVAQLRKQALGRRGHQGQCLHQQQQQQQQQQEVDHHHASVEELQQQVAQHQPKQPQHELQEQGHQSHCAQQQRQLQQQQQPQQPQHECQGQRQQQWEGALQQLSTPHHEHQHQLPTPHHELQHQHQQQQQHQSQLQQQSLIQQQCDWYQCHRPQGQQPRHHSAIQWLASGNALDFVPNRDNTCMLVVSGIPAHAQLSDVKCALMQAFARFGCSRVSLSRKNGGGSHGWARVTIPQGQVHAALALDGTLLQVPCPSNPKAGPQPNVTPQAGVPRSHKPPDQPSPVGVAPGTYQPSSAQHLIQPPIASQAASPQLPLLETSANPAQAPWDQPSLMPLQSGSQPPSNSAQPSIQLSVATQPNTTHATDPSPDPKHCPLASYPGQLASLAPLPGPRAPPAPLPSHLCFPISVSRSCGRADTLFPSVSPASLRAQLKIDPVAAYSVSDASTADSVAQMLAVLASAATAANHASSAQELGPQQHRHHQHLCSKQPGDTSQKQQQEQCPQQQQQQAQLAQHHHQSNPMPTSLLNGNSSSGSQPGSAFASLPPASLPLSAIHHQHQAHQGIPMPFSLPPPTSAPSHSTSTAAPLPTTKAPAPLSVTDATACAGGSTAALAHWFGGRLVAVEVDEDRAQDLLHNLQVMGIARREEEVSNHSLRRPSQLQHAQDQQPPDQNQRQGKQQIEEHHSKPAPETHKRDCQPQPSQQQQQQQQQSVQSQQPASQAVSVHEHTVPPRSVHVLCGDYTHLAWQLPPQDVVFFDPPWGGPDYLQGCLSDGGTKGVDEAADEAAGGAASCAGSVYDEGGPQRIDPESSQKQRLHTTEQKQQPASGQQDSLHHHQPQQQEQQPAFLQLGGSSMSTLCGRLLGSGRATVVGIRLPASAAASQSLQILQEAAKVARLYHAATQSSAHPCSPSPSTTPSPAAEAARISSTNTGSVQTDSRHHQFSGLWGVQGRLGRSLLVCLVRLPLPGAAVARQASSSKQKNMQPHPVSCTAESSYSEDGQQREAQMHQGSAVLRSALAVWTAASKVEGGSVIPYHILGIA